MLLYFVIYRNEKTGEVVVAGLENSTGELLESAACPWVTGQVVTPTGPISRVATRLSWRDRLGAWAVRWNMGRRRYRIKPGLYAAGSPKADSPVLVSANYKLSFDTVRQAVNGMDVWILVLDTQGINVWCAAGKGTFGTEELVHRMETEKLAQIAPASTLVLPQLSAPGVAIHRVRQQTGFPAVYGPVYVRDLPAFLHNGMKATPAMRRVGFTLSERLAVVPVELVRQFVPAMLIMIIAFLVAGVGLHGFRLAQERWPGIGMAIWANYFSGLLLIPVFLPWLPGRAFAVKGAWAGLATGGVLAMLGRYGFIETVALGLVSIAVCSFLGLMFTGSTPYTSVSGVRRELRWAIPAQIGTVIVGLSLWFVNTWHQGGI